MRLALLLTLLTSPAWAARYTLPELLARVERANPGVEAAAGALETARALVGQAEMQWAPNGDFFAKLLAVPKVHNVTESDGSQIGLATNYVDWLRPGPLGLKAAEPFQGVWFTFSFSFIQPLYTFGKIHSATGAAKGGVRAAEGYREMALADALLEARRSFWLIKCERAARLVMDDIVARLDAQVAEFQADMEGANRAGYTEADLARLKAALESSRVSRFELERQESSALASMRALARDPEADVDDTPPALAAEVARTLDAYQDAGATRRAEIKLLEGGKQAAQFFARWRFADMLPSLAYLSGFGFGQSSSMDNPLASSVVGAPNPAIPYFSLGPLIVHWDLDLAVRAGRLREARAAEQAMRETERWARGGIRVDVAKAWADHQEAVQRAAELAHAEKVARGWFSTVQDNMASGITAASDARELVDAMRVYFDFRLRHMLAILDANMTLAWLERVSGAQ